MGQQCRGSQLIIIEPNNYVPGQFISTRRTLSLPHVVDVSLFRKLEPYVGGDGRFELNDKQRFLDFSAARLRLPLKLN